MVRKNWAVIRRTAVLAVAAGVACLLVAQAVQWRASELSRLKESFVKDVRDENAATALHFDDLLQQLYKDLRRVSRLPDVRSISADGKSLTGNGRRNVQELYNDLVDTLNVSEIYIVPRDLDPDATSGAPKEPITTFDELIVGKNASKSKVHQDVEEVEIFEYREMRRQCAILNSKYGSGQVAETLSVPFVSSKEVITCDNSHYDPAKPDDHRRSGVVYSVPFFDEDGHFKGLVSAVVLSDVLAEHLPTQFDSLVNEGTGYVVRQGPATSAQPLDEPTVSLRKDLRMSDLAGTWTVKTIKPTAPLTKGPEMRSLQYLFSARLLVAAGTGAIVLVMAGLEVAWRRKQAKLERELKTKVDEQTSALTKLVQDLENANTEQVAQAQELTDYADELQARQEEIERALADAEIQTSLYAHASKRFESLFNGLPVGCATFNTEGEVMEWNTTMSLIARCAPHEALLRPISHVFRGVDERQMQAAVEDSLAKGVASSFESEWSREGVEETFVHVSVFPMRQKSGEIVGGIMCVFDTTQAAQAARAVALSEAKLRAFIDHAPAAVAIFDRQVCYLAASKRWYADYNIEGQEIIGKSHYEVFPEIGEEWKQIHQQCLSGETVTRDEDRFERLDGTVHWMRWEVRPWYDQAGVIGGIAMMTEDISERKAVMEQLYEAHEEVSSILESINDAFMSINNEGVVVYINQTACQVLNIGKDAAEDKSLKESCPRSLYNAIVAMCEQARKLATKQDMELEFEGSWLEFRVYPSKDGHSIFFQDITDRKTIQMQVDSLLVQMNDVNVKLELNQAELEEANKNLKALATTDGLTGIHNHRYFQDFLAKNLAAAQVEGGSIGVILMDVDKFKSFNDDFGHQAGDAVLIGVAACLRRIVKEPHLVARYGGEEFVVVTVGLDERQNWDFAESLRLEIESELWPGRPVTASFGVASCQACDCKPHDMIERADRALYRSKLTGRNRTTVYGNELEAA